MASFVTPRDLLRSGAGPVGRLGLKAAQLAEATRVLREHLDPPLADRTSVAAIREPTTLVVAVDSPVWASRLHYQSEEILDHFAKTLGRPRLSRLKTLVRPPPPAAAPSRAPARLSRPSARLVRSVSETLEPGPLRESIERLAPPDTGPPEEDAAPG